MNSSLVITINVVVIVIWVLSTILSGLIGFFKGVYKTTLKIILKVALITIIIFACPGMANAVGNINIQGFVGYSDPVSLQSYIANQLTETGLVSPVNGLSLYETSIALVNSGLAYALFLLWMILIQIVISPLAALIYNGILRLFLHVETRKEKKKRKAEGRNGILTGGLVDEENKLTSTPKKKLPLLQVPAALLGAVQEFVFVFVLICPITALVSVSVHNKDHIHDAIVSLTDDEELLQTTDETMATLSECPLYTVSELLTLDDLIMDKVSRVNLNDTNITFTGLIDSAFDVADPLLKNGTFSYDEGSKAVTISFSKLLSVSTIDSLVTAMLRNKMILALLPPIIDMAVNSVSATSFAVDSLDLSNIDWSSDLTIINSVYQKIYGELISPIISEEDKINPYNYIIKASTMSDETIEEISSALESLGKLQVIQKNAATILASIGTFLENRNISILPTDSEAYANVDWSHDLSLFGKVALQFFRSLHMDISRNITADSFRESFFNSLGDDTERANLKVYINGDEDNEGLLDLDLFDAVSIADIIDTTLSSIHALKPYLKDVNAKDILGSYTREQYKEEVNTIFDMAGNIFGENSHISLTNFSTANLNDEETTNQLAELLDISGKSHLFTTLYPKILKSFLFNNNFDFSGYLFGLTPYNFNYEGENFVSDFRQLLLLIPKIRSMFDNIHNTSLSLSDRLNLIDTGVIQTLLEIVCGSELFNSDVYTGVTSEKQKNVNIHTLLSNMMDNDLFNSFGLVCPSLDTFQTIQWQDSGTQKGEISMLCSLIDSLKANSEFITSSVKDFNQIQDYDEIYNLVKNGLDSKLVSPSVLEIIDTSLNQYLADIGIHISMNEMRNSMWADDADEIAELMKLFKGLDLDHLDFDSLDMNLFNAILTLLNRCNFIKTSNDNSDYFGYAISEILLKQGLFDTLGITSPNSSVFLSEEEAWDEEESEAVLEDGTIATITSKGRIASLCQFIQVIQKYGTSNLTGGKLPDGFIEEMKPLLKESSMLRNIFASYLETSISLMNLGSDFTAVLQSIDFASFASFSSSQLDTDLELFQKLYTWSNTTYEGENKLSYMLSHINSLKEHPNEDDTTLLDDFYSLCDLISSSTLMNQVKEGYFLSPLALLFKGLIQSNGLMEKVTLTSSLQEQTLNSLLLSVTDWSTEISSLKTIVSDLQGLECASLAIANASLTMEKASLLFQDMNQSSLFHRVPISVLKSAFEENDIDSMLTDPNNGKVVHPLNWLVHLSANQEDISYWQNEIDNFLEVVLGEEGLITIFKDSSQSLKALSLDALIDEEDTDKNYLSFLYYLGKIKTFSLSRSYFLYHLLSNSCNGFDLKKVFKEADAPYGDNKTVYRLEELFFNNPKLLDTNQELEESKAKNDLAMLQSILNPLLKSLNTLASGDDVSSISMDFEALTDATLSFSDGKTSYTQPNYYRSDLTSELVAGAMTAFINNPLFDGELASARDLDFYADSYALVNPMEGRGLNGLLELKKLPSIDITAGEYYTHDQLANIYSLFGDLNPDIEDEIALAKVNCFLAKSEYSKTGNSLIISTISDSLLFALTVKEKDQDSTSLLSDLIEEEYTSEKHSYFEIFSSVDLM